MNTVYLNQSFNYYITILIWLRNWIFDNFLQEEKGKEQVGLPLFAFTAMTTLRLDNTAICTLFNNMRSSLLYMTLANDSTSH